MDNNYSEHNWERSQKIIEISLTEVQITFPELKITSISSILNGCRNTNYIIHSTNHKYLLRLFSDKNELINNEINAYKLLHIYVNMPNLIAVGQILDYKYILYEFIEGEIFQSYIDFNKFVSEDCIRQVANNLALIHNAEINNCSLFVSFDLPPYNQWYSYFLSSLFLQKRLGKDLLKQVTGYLDANKIFFDEIESYQSLIHCDFRPANMILSSSQKLYIIDWEYSGKGHSLADIGQFFRYSRYFTQKNRDQFFEEYNRLAILKLPDNWYKLCRIRDLVNPLQLLGSEQEKPIMYKDLLNVVKDIISEN
ncbi:MAG: aminoglycoside phosphotransferase family protein [Candidatus Cloacimonetes bacterium]|nr:aminoglycoside phosphotransferase family protein [Candidatus Cloacimonadota bacterium]MDD4155503.1 aminoglycoside phosphotransferase family protein [Candidatus Cloacimonadota bacterium]